MEPTLKKTMFLNDLDTISMGKTFVNNTKLFEKYKIYKY